MKYNIGTVWNMSDTVTYKKIENQLWLLNIVKQKEKNIDEY